MGKKPAFLCIFLLGAIGVYFLYLDKSFVQNTKCPFCDPDVLQKQTVYEDDLVLALYTHKPVVLSHFLIIPKRHVERLDQLSEKEMCQIYRTIQKVNQASMKVFDTFPYFIHEKNGKEVWQSVPHIHFHLIAKKSQDDSLLKFVIQILFAQWKGPISEHQMQDVITKMKNALESDLS